MRLISGKQVLS